ncbi:MAG: response regulator, partial [Myxococcales bacterium]|nr:response regulator [Myxococcales bacterium]
MPKTLLLADDSVTIQKVVGISFANEDVILLTVDNGDDAIHKAREVRPDLVLADVVMPGKNGYEVCATIKADPDLGSTPVMLLTGTFEAFDDARAQEVGADGHITKPFEAQALVDRVNAL